MARKQKEGWSRCGESPYFKKGSGFTQIYVDPVGLAVVMAGSGEVNQFDDGAVVMARAVAPYYDWHALQIGAERLYKNEEQRLGAIGMTHGWMTIRKRNLKGLGPEALLSEFMDYSPEGMGLICEGVVALLEGLEQLHLEDPVVYPNPHEEAVVVLKSGSPAERNKARISEYLGVKTHWIHTEDLHAGLADALDRLDIPVC